MAHDERAIMAANNNADIYTAMFSAWGLRYDRLPFAFVGRDPPPPYHSNLTVLAPDCRLQVIAELQVLARSFHGVVGFKDSFHEFDLREKGLELLFGAEWIWRAAQAVRIPDGWTRVETPQELRKWEDAWKRYGSPAEAHLFRDCLLQRADLAFLGKNEGSEFVAGCIANNSGDCVGISNVYSAASNTKAFQEATAAVASINPDLPLVGYAAGSALQAARQAGYETTGSLQILIVTEANI